MREVTRKQNEIGVIILIFGLLVKTYPDMEWFAAGIKSL
jgi:hypothetical protein